ncbi:MAG: hypothetical protein ACHRHE_19485, partial [Tepidisphaerales bacterium]
ALLLATGWEWAFERIGARGIFAWAGAAAVLPLAANFFVYRVVPVRMSRHEIRSAEAAQWVQTSPLVRDYPRLMAPCSEVYYHLHLSPTNFVRSANWPPKTSEQNGIMLIWDPIYAEYNADRGRVMSAENIAMMGWVPVHIFNKSEKPGQTEIERMARKITDDALGDWIVFLSPCDKDGHPTDPARRVLLPSTRPSGER